MHIHKCINVHIIYLLCYIYIYVYVYVYVCIYMCTYTPIWTAAMLAMDESLRMHPPLCSIDQIRMLVCTKPFRYQHKEIWWILINSLTTWMIDYLIHSFVIWLFFYSGGACLQVKHNESSYFSLFSLFYFGRSGTFSVWILSNIMQQSDILGVVLS